MDRRVLIVALGMFVIGTEGFVIAGVLPRIAVDLDVSLASAGLLVTAFGLIYAVSAPFVGAGLANLDRRRVLSGAMLAFAGANVLAAAAPTFGVLAVARMLSAVTAAAYSPVAVAAAVQMSPPERRGRATGLVFGGLTLALVTGVPLGTLLADLTSWRGTFVFIALLALAAAGGVWFFLPAISGGARMPVGQRLRPLRRRVVVLTLLSPYIWMTGGFAVYTFVAVLLARSTDWSVNALTPILLVYGVFALLGNNIGGRITDTRLGTTGTLSIALLIQTGSLLGLALAAELGPPAGTVLFLTSIAFFAASGWACTPPQATRALALSTGVTTELLSLNSMTTYLGIATGAAIGGLVLGGLGVVALALLAAATQIVALLLMLRVDKLAPSPDEAAARTLPVA